MPGKALASFWDTRIQNLLFVQFSAMRSGLHCPATSIEAANCSGHWMFSSHELMQPMDWPVR